MRDLDHVFQACCRTLDSLKIKYSPDFSVVIDTRAKRRWGSCQKKKDGSYVIKISSALLNEDVPLDSLKTTVYHELLHTVPRAMGHGKTWLQLARKVNEATGLNIKPSTPASEKGVQQDYAHDPSVKLLCVCQGCGAEVVRYRKCDFAKQLHRYRCGRCGGQFRVIFSRFQ